MKIKHIVEVGQRFGRLDVIGFAETSHTRPHRYIICKCDCGTTKEIRKSSLIDGFSNSCGCLSKELKAERTKTHGLSMHPLYSVWYGMIKRCYNQKSKDYKHYGGRGIIVEDEWRYDSGLLQFIEDMSSEYEPGLELDRVDVNGNYCRENCRWATRREQVINRRPTGLSFDTHYLSHNGETLCISEWAEKLHIPASMLSDRISKLGWPVEKAFSEKPKTRDSRVVIEGTHFNPKKDIFKTYPNVFGVANKFGISGHEYIALLFKGIGKVEVLLCKEWVEFNLPKELENFDIASRKVPVIRESFPYKDLITGVSSNE